MTPELRAHIARRARELRATLNASAPAGILDVVTVASAGRELFTEAADPVRVRWLNLELGGYGNLVDERPLHLVLGVGREDRLVAHVAAYRAQRGVALTPALGGLYTHFFVEPLDAIVATRDQIRASSGTSELELSFGQTGTPTSLPTSARFPRDVFERIAGGFAAALFLQLGTLVG